MKKLPKEFIQYSHHVLREYSMCAVQNVYILKTWILKERRAYILPDFHGIDEVDSQVQDKLLSIYSYFMSSDWLKRRKWCGVVV